MALSLIESKIKDLFPNTHITCIQDVVALAPKVMESVEKAAALSGPDKKILAINVVSSFITNQELKVMAGLVLPPIIDTLADVSKGVYEIQKKVCAKCCIVC